MTMKSICGILRLFPVAVVLPAAISAQSLFAQVTESEYGCYSFSFDVVMPGTPGEMYDAATGDISGWWDHTFSEKPVELFIDAVPGGQFREVFDEEGNGVIHATVIYADRGKVLRMNGPLGLSGKAMDGIFTCRFEANGDNTIVSFEANLAGQITAGEAAAVEGVWHHFLEDRLKPYLEDGTP